MTTLVLRKADKRPPPAFFALVDEMGLLTPYDDEDSFVKDETARVHKNWVVA